MNLRPDVRGGKAWACLHGAPIARERRAFWNFGAEAGKLHAREKYGPHHISNPIGRRHHHGGAIAKRLLQPIHEADRLGAASLCKLHNGSRIEGADARGESRCAYLIGLSEIGIFGGPREEAATGGFEPLGNHLPCQGIAGEKPAEGQLFDRVGVVKIEPCFRLAIEARLAEAERAMSRL